jgi:hypothetical protein
MLMIDVHGEVNQAGPPGDHTPAEFSDDEENDDPAFNALNKQTLLEWLTVADFTQEI